MLTFPFNLGWDIMTTKELSFFVKVVCGDFENTVKSNYR